MSQVSEQTSVSKKEEANKEKLVLARSVVSSFTQSLKKMSLYLHQTEGLESFFETSLEQMKVFHQKHGSLSLVVKPFDFFFNGESVYQSDGQENSLTFKLYSAGIRSFTFEKGMMAHDLVSIGRLLLKTPLELQQEDIASWLWRESVPHISYLQIHSSETHTDDNDDSFGEEEENIENIRAYIQEKFSSKDSRNLVNFRSFSSVDVGLEEFLGSSKTQRELFEQPRPMSAREIGYIRDVIALEEKQLIVKGSELLFFLCKHAENPDELQEAEETFSLLCEHLFFSFDFVNLTKLLDALESLASQTVGKNADSFLALKKTLFDAFLEEERFLIFKDYLENLPSIREKERNRLCLFMKLLGPKFHDLLQGQMMDVSSKTRRLFLLTLLSSVNNPHSLSISLLEQFDESREFLIDLLHTGRIIPLTFSRTQLEALLKGDDAQVQRLALTIFIEQYPGEMSDVSGGFLKNATSDVVRALFEVLCQSEGSGLASLFAFVQTKRFGKLDFEDQIAMYTLLGRSRFADFLDWFDYLLGQQSRFYRPRLEKEKQLAIKGLEAFGSFSAMGILQKHAERSNHSEPLGNELAHAVTFYHLYIKSHTQNILDEGEDEDAR